MHTSKPKVSHVTHDGSAVAGIGHFMVAVGAVIELANSGKFLLLKRSDEFHKNAWEFVYGRIDQGENLETALRREVREETGIDELEVIDQFSTWHMYRGDQTSENEVIGISFYCRTNTAEPKLSSEHSQFKWATLEEASKLVSVEGIVEDLNKFKTFLSQKSVIEQYRSQAERALADYQNLVRRQQDDRQKFARLANLDFISSLLEPLDHLQLASAQLKDKGLEMVVGQLTEKLKSQGLESINPLGQAFDVATMEAVDIQGEGKTVGSVIKPGWKLYDQVIQHAKVGLV